MSLPHLDSIGFTTADLEASVAFYTQRLGFRRLGEPLALDGGGYADLVGLPEARLRLQRLAIGSEVLELSQVLDPGAHARPGRPISQEARSNDRSFQHICLVVNSIEAALEPLRADLASGRLRPISSGPQRLPDWNPGAAGIVAFKFRDPEGHALELLQFPADKGEARWHQAAAGPLLGIDHSAIGVAATAATCRFYDELIGLRLGGDGINSGVEQDQLDGLAGTRVRITAHRCGQGAGIEALNYLEPAGGRPLPGDQGPQDLAHWQLRLRVADLDSLLARVEACGGRVVSPGIVDLGDQAELIGARRALQLADPDGHRLQLLEG